MSVPNDIADPVLRPRDPVTREASPPRSQPGYYEGFSTLSQKRFWDKATREAVVKRVASSPERLFFSALEWSFWTAVFSHLMPQTDRTPDRQILIVPSLDRRLRLNQTVGYRYENMPEDRAAYRLGMEAVNQESQHRYNGEFLLLPHLQQELVLKALHDGEPAAAAEIWKEMSVHRFWQLIMQDAIEAYYGHPWAWDEIGFGGPAYPRAYTRLERGEPEPWEVEEQRYEWLAPASSISDEVEPATDFHLESEQHRLHSSKRSL